MKNQLLTIKSLIALAIFSFSVESISAKDIPLFQSDEPLELTLETDVVALIEDKSDEPEYSPAKIIHHQEDFKINAFDIKVKARGQTRRNSDLCDFPPLKFNFIKKTLKNSVFEGQDKLKFVAQCRQQEAFDNYVLEEYLLYKTYNIITEESYKVRLVNITIRDNKLRFPEIQMIGFLIEDDKALAKRIDAKSFKEHIYSQDTCTDVSVDRFAMFQFMAGNTDWYINTKHNTDIFKNENDSSFIPVPFDFDGAGVIKTIYAKPSNEIPITDVRKRYFKGSCRDFGAYAPTIQLFNEKRDEIYVLYSSFEYLPKYVIKKSLKYYDKFYKIINDPEIINATFFNVCNPVLLNTNAIN